MAEHSTREGGRHKKLRLAEIIALGILMAAAAQAQSTAPAGALPAKRQLHPAASAMTSPASNASGKAAMQTPPLKSAPAAAQPSSLRDEPPQPAVIELKGGKLRIEANNSALDDILHAVATQSGMQIHGLNRNYRVFGSYGPANPRKVLSELLSDSGWNVVMIGALADGAPEQLLLTVRGNTPPTPPNPNDPEEAYTPPPRTVY